MGSKTLDGGKPLCVAMPQQLPGLGRRGRGELETITVHRDQSARERAGRLHTLQAVSGETLRELGVSDASTST